MPPFKNPRFLILIVPFLSRTRQRSFGRCFLVAPSIYSPSNLLNGRERKKLSRLSVQHRDSRKSSPHANGKRTPSYNIPPPPLLNTLLPPPLLHSTIQPSS